MWDSKTASTEQWKPSPAWRRSHESFIHGAPCTTGSLPVRNCFPSICNLLPYHLLQGLWKSCDFQGLTEPFKFHVFPEFCNFHVLSEPCKFHVFPEPCKFVYFLRCRSLSHLLEGNISFAGSSYITLQKNQRQIHPESHFTNKTLGILA